MITALCVIFMIFVSLEYVKNVFWVVARLPQRLKSTFFEIFSHSAGPFGTAPFEIFPKKMILAFEANSARSLTRKNETKIVKITHSAMVL